MVSVTDGGVIGFGHVGVELVIVEFDRAVRLDNERRKVVYYESAKNV